MNIFAPTDQNKKLADELTHITQEMYKKNLELTERNKILALLRNIDQIVLGSLTKVEQIADQVVHTIVQNSDFKSVFLYLLDKNKEFLNPLAVAFAKTETKINDDVLHVYYNAKIAYTEENNPLIQAIKNKKIITIADMHTFFKSYLTKEACFQTQETLEIKRFIIHPFFMRSDITGAIVIGLGEEDIKSQYWNDLILRLPEVISISLGNALLYEKLEDSNNRLKELDRLKDEFVSIASHELRTPMTAIKSYLWMVLYKNNEPIFPKSKEYINIAYSSTERLIRLVQDMLTISRIEGNRFEMQKEKINLYQIAEDTYKELNIKAQESSIIFTISEPQELFVFGDKDRIREVFQNIIGNSLKFTPKGGKISISLSKKDKQIETRIQDTGPGIAKEDIPKLFEKFARVGQSYTKIHPVAGTGLGLYITKQIIELHRGKIEVESEIGSGTAFIFSFPEYTGNERG